MQTILEKEEYNIVYNPHDAHIIVVNTCGFIESAKEESIDEILSMAAYKNNSDKKLLVSGCLAQRYPDELTAEIPEIDGLIGTGHIKDIGHYIELLDQGKEFKSTGNINAEYTEGIFKSNPDHIEYVKISEGCNNHCTYCIIPSLRGKNRSRRIEDIVEEVDYLVENGAKEIVLIAQNTTDYGIDLYGDYRLAKLLQELEKIEKLKWIRVLYLYPDNFDDRLVEEFNRNSKLLAYVDIPLQHVSDNVLKAMNRRTDKKMIEDLITKLRAQIPNLVIRSTFIVGFPGESQEDFEELLDFVKTFKLDKLGVFTYSKEENTPAYGLDGHIDEDIKNIRRDKIMEAQRQISQEILEKNLQRTYEMIIDEINEDHIVARPYMDTIEIDGLTYVNTDKTKGYKVGDFIQVRIIDTMDYDMIGEIV